MKNLNHLDVWCFATAPELYAVGPDWPYNLFVNNQFFIYGQFGPPSYYPVQLSFDENDINVTEGCRPCIDCIWKNLLFFWVVKCIIEVYYFLSKVNEYSEMFYIFLFVINLSIIRDGRLIFNSTINFVKWRFFFVQHG